MACSTSGTILSGGSRVTIGGLDGSLNVISGAQRSGPLGV